jgi:hypothetical protein
MLRWSELTTRDRELVRPAPVREPRVAKTIGFGLGVLALVAIGCRAKPLEPAAETTRSPNAQPEVVQALRDDLAAVRHPSDGGGRAWLEEGSNPATAGAAGTWTINYETGPHGIGVDGMVFLQVSPFWGWSTPQVEAEEALGYTTVTTDAEGVTLEAQTLGQQLLGITVEGRSLEDGERVRIVYGAGPRGARADTYAERGSRFWISVDGDGDGIRGLLPDSPTVDVGPGPPRRMVLTLPSVARPGETVRLNLAVLDAAGSAWPVVEGEVALSATGVEVRLPATVHLAPEDRGRVVTFTVTRACPTGPGRPRTTTATPGTSRRWTSRCSPTTTIGGCSLCRRRRSSGRGLAPRRRRSTIPADS